MSPNPSVATVTMDRYSASSRPPREGACSASLMKKPPARGGPEMSGQPSTINVTQDSTTTTIASGPARTLTRRRPRRGRPARHTVARSFRPSPPRPLGCQSVWKMSRRAARTTAPPIQVTTQPATCPTAGSLPATSGAVLPVVHVDVVHVVLRRAAAIRHHLPGTARRAEHALLPDDVLHAELVPVVDVVPGDRVTEGGVRHHHVVQRQSGRVAVRVGSAGAGAAEGDAVGAGHVRDDRVGSGLDLRLHTPRAVGDARDRIRRHRRRSGRRGRRGPGGRSCGGLLDLFLLLRRGSRGGLGGGAGPGPL